ncbi:hypothetical protein PENTCL1PPCAC_22041, partial [Pristionchus entomophagus]
GSMEKTLLNAIIGGISRLYRLVRRLSSCLAPVSASARADLSVHEFLALPLAAANTGSLEHNS